MNKDHVSQIAHLEAQCFSDPWSEKSIASELENPLSLWLVAEENGQVWGYVGSQTLIAELSKMGSRCLRLEVRVSNENARALYARMGFQQLGLRKNYYHNPKEDALILGKEWEN